MNFTQWMFHLASIMAVILIKLVIAPYSNFTVPQPSTNTLSTPKNHKNHTTTPAVIYNRNLVMSRQTQDNIYADVLRNIRASGMHDYNTTKLSGTKTQKKSLTNSGYLVGYSSDPFGTSHELSGDYRLTQKSKGVRKGGKSRHKRGVIGLYNMVVCATGCDPLSYKGYGCYCGFLGSGYVVDEIDSCCRRHDSCYDSAGCPMFLEYFIPYLWKCYHGQPLCAINQGDSSRFCARRLCECDRALANCLRQYPCPQSKALCMSSNWRLFQNLFML